MLVTTVVSIVTINNLCKFDWVVMQTINWDESRSHACVTTTEHADRIDAHAHIQAVGAAAQNKFRKSSQTYAQRDLNQHLR